MEGTSPKEKACGDNEKKVKERLNCKYMKTTNPLVIERLQFAIYSSEKEIKYEFHEDGLTGIRKRLPVKPTHTLLAVLFEVSNIRLKQEPDIPIGGVRRSVAVALIDANEESVIEETEIRVTIPRGTVSGIFHAEIPVAYFDINFEHYYKIEVRDNSNKDVIWDETFHFIDTFNIYDTDPDDERDSTSADFVDDDEFEKRLRRFIISELKTDPSSEANEETDTFSIDEDEKEPDIVADETEQHPEDEPQDLLAPLDNLVGLESVKEKLTTYERVVRFNKMRERLDLPGNTAPLHAMYLGSPGTGKTTIAKLMGRMLHHAGVLTSGHVVVRERANLLGQNYNSESENTLKAIEEAQGGILFIDEAHQLYQPEDRRDPGKFVIETLLTALSEPSMRDWMLILAGYPEEMEKMFEMNPGFKSRIPESNIYTFEDFTKEQLFEIAENYFRRQQYTLSPGARYKLMERLDADYENRDKTFGNGRHVMNLIQTEIIPAMAVRVTNANLCDINALTEVKPEDIPLASIDKKKKPRLGFCA